MPSTAAPPPNRPAPKRSHHAFRGTPPPATFDFDALPDGALLTEHEVAAVARLSTNTLAAWRLRGKRRDHRLPWIAITRQRREVPTMNGDTDLATALVKAITTKPSSKWTLLDGYPCATSDFFFKDGDDQPVALILPGRREWHFLSPDDARRRDERIHGTEPRESPERQFEDALYQQLIAAGHVVRRQVRTRAGIIDLLVQSDPPMLIEVKTIGAIFTIARAAAQLWGYARDYPGARLLVAALPPVSPDARAFLERLGIGLWS